MRQWNCTESNPHSKQFPDLSVFKCGRRGDASRVASPLHFQDRHGEEGVGRQAVFKGQPFPWALGKGCRHTPASWNSGLTSLWGWVFRKLYFKWVGLLLIAHCWIQLHVGPSKKQTLHLIANRIAPASFAESLYCLALFWLWNKKDKTEIKTFPYSFFFFLTSQQTRGYKINCPTLPTITIWLRAKHYCIDFILKTRDLILSWCK